MKPASYLFSVLIFCACLMSLPLSASDEMKTPPMSVSEPIKFQPIFDYLDQIMTGLIEKEKLPKDKWFSRDQSDAQADINKSIESAIRLLDSPRMIVLRDSYSKIENLIADEHAQIADLRERRQFAVAADTTLLTKYTPTETLRKWTLTTRGDFDYAISLHEKNIEAYNESASQIIDEMSKLLQQRGIELPPDQVQIWLSSVVGGDIIKMGIVFRSIYDVTLQLRELTIESNENLDFAKRYYGMMVALHGIMIDMQSRFISDIDNNYLPQLTKFEREANAVISESRSLLESGNRDVLENNIAANKQTIQAIRTYRSILIQERKRVLQAQKISESEFRVALNTYKTVNLSSQVVSLVSSAVQSFETVIGLQAPETIQFQNLEMSNEFKRLSIRLNKL